MSSPSKRRKIGWREYVAFPDWNVRRVRAKVDTGANTSSLDAFDVRETGDGTITFKVVEARRPRVRWSEASAAVVRRTVVRSSNGEREQRYVVRTSARIGGDVFPIEMTLVARPGLLCRMLLGRRALAGRFVVDCEHKYLATGLHK